MPDPEMPLEKVEGIVNEGEKTHEEFKERAQGTAAEHSERSNVVEGEADRREELASVPLEEWTTAELRERARQLDLGDADDMHRSDLIAAIRDHDS